MLENIIENNKDAKIDLRPYIWENPITLSIYEDLEKCLKTFMVHHLRHLIITNPADGSVAGIITRKDLFAYVSL